jgi:hypothetical protein
MSCKLFQMMFKMGGSLIALGCSIVAYGRKPGPAGGTNEPQDSAVDLTVSSP